MDQFKYILLWLIAAFLIADYPLQLNLVFEIRYKYRFGGLLHVAIHALAGLFLLYPYLAHWQIWAAFGATIILHYFIDTVSKTNIYMWLADQASHIVLIAGVAFLGRHLQPLPLPHIVAQYYFNAPFALYVIGYLAATFAGTIFIFFVKMTFRKGYQTRPILLYEKTTGVVSRAVVVTAIILGFKLTPAFFFVAPVPDLLRLYQVVTLRGDERHYKDVYPADVLISFLYAAAIGVALAFV
ncbi:MAG TPA: DUF3307 domain-containing protein [bacterium]|nr:DUF3307 domain-containing protein [bacterium]